jgi:hypothetical protein
MHLQKLYAHRDAEYVYFSRTPYTEAHIKIPRHYSNAPTKRNRWTLIDCVRVRIVWDYDPARLAGTPDEWKGEPR